MGLTARCTDSGGKKTQRQEKRKQGGLQLRRRTIYEIQEAGRSPLAASHHVALSTNLKNIKERGFVRIRRLSLASVEPRSLAGTDPSSFFLSPRPLSLSYSSPYFPSAASPKAAGRLAGSENKVRNRGEQRGRVRMEKQKDTRAGGRKSFLAHLLDRRRLLETVGVDATQKLLAKLHRIESLDALIPVRLDVILGQRLILCRRSLVPGHKQT